MAGKERQKRETMAQEIFHILFVVNVFQCFSPCIATVESPNQVFVQTDKELRYLGDGLPLHGLPGESIHGMNLPDGTISPASHIRFHPQLLDFQEQPVGMPHTQQVTVQNPDTVNSLHLLSISGSTIHFHCSFFQDKLVPPGGNTSFDVVFLAREVGNVENTLYIHTSQGSFKYQVFGVGIANPYRIRPFVGAKMPVNSSFSPLIHMHNPHSSTLQIEEIYTSGGDLHLELPTGEREASQDLWEIGPYETKSIMKASFVGRIENNHTAFIRIRTNQDQQDGAVLVLPVEVEVTASPGIFSPLEILDFGIVRTLDEPKSLRLNLLNSGINHSFITNVTVVPPNSAIHVDFRPVQLKPDVLQPTAVALISFSASRATQPKQWSGKIVVRSKTENYKLSIPYQATVLHGSLVYDRNRTMFYTGHSPATNVSRELPITNTFNFTLVVYNVSVPSDVQHYFSVDSLSAPVQLGSQETASVFSLTFHPNTTMLHLTTSLQLHTNASVFAIPIHVYNGRLKVVHHRPEIFKGQLDFGTLGKSEHRTMTFTLRNDNPLDVVIKDFSSNMENTEVELLGVERGNATTLTREHNTSELDIKPLVLKPYHFAVFSVKLMAPNWEGTFAAEVILVTQFENLYIPMTLRTAEGSLTADPDKVLFEKCFPGKVSQKELRIHSSFDHYMEVRDLTFKPSDSRFSFVAPKEKPITLEPHQDSYIGKLLFDPQKDCSDECYTGLPVPSLPFTKKDTLKLGYQWLLGLTLDKEVADIDQFLYTKARHKWESHNFMQTNTVNVTMQLDTNQVRGFLFPAQAHLQWPSLSRKSRISFPLTQIGNISVSELVLENPGNAPVLAQVLALPVYPNPETILDLVAQRQYDLGDLIETEDHGIFILQDLERYNSSSTVAKLRQNIESQFGVKTHPSSIPVLIAGGERAKISIGFQPKDDLLRSSLIVIRNNLTVVDVIVVQGQGGRGELRFNTRKAGSQMPLLFELTEKHLKNCDTSSSVVAEKRNKGISPNFTVRRTFTARNTGQLPLYINNFSINQESCMGYGFRVLDCHGFEMAPNTTRKIDIAFTPDFTMARIQHVLTIHTSLGQPLDYTLQATVPAHMLTRCAAALPRLTWEPILFYSTLCIMGFLLFCILVAAYFEADRIFHTDVIKRRQKIAAQAYDKNKVLDLRSIGTSVREGSGIGRVSVVKNHADVGNGHVEVPPMPHPPRRKKEPSSFMLRLPWRWLFRGSSTATSAAPHDTRKQNLAVHTSTTREHVSDGSSSKNPRSAGPASASHTHSGNRASKPTFLQRLFGSSRDRTRPAGSTAGGEAKHDLNPSNVNGLTDSKRTAANNGILPHTPSNPGSSSSSSSSSSSYPHVFNGSSSTNHPKKRPVNKISDSAANSCMHTNARQSIDHDKDQAKVAKRATADRSGSMGLDSLDAPPTATTVDEDDDSATGKKEAKRPRQKKASKADLRREERERLQKDKLFKEKVMQELAERDDTSSTTTETSSLDPDDSKVSSARDSTPELTAPKTKKLRSKGKKTKSGSTGLDADEANEDEFMISSKSKAQKNIKVDRKMAFGGNVFMPITYELPYTTKLEAEAKEKAEKRGAGQPGAAPATTDKQSRKTNKGSRSKGAIDLRPALEGDRPASVESLSPAWDSPLQTNHTAGTDLSELSIQTEHFAKNAISRTASGCGPLGANTPLSYSGAVSGAALDTSPPVSKSRVQGGYGGSSESSPGSMSGLGLDMKSVGTIGSKQAIGSKPHSPSMSGLHGASAWSTSPASTPSPDPLSSNPLGLHVSPNEADPASRMRNDGRPVTSVFGLQDGLGQLGFAESVGPTYEQRLAAQQQAAEQTFMQKLRQDRRMRVHEYQQKVLQDDWPGFDLGAQPHSLWDNSRPTSDGWSTVTDSPPRPKPSPALWDPPLSSAAPNSWGTSPVWNSSPAAPAVSSGALLDMGATGGLENSDTPSPGATNSFDPFNTLSSIWNPTSTSSGGGGWGFPSSSDQNHD